ncbi:MAG: hypothetical protein ABRQ23_03565 [Syntrophomonadaceae bacterium]
MRRGISIFTAIVRIYILQLTAILAVWLAMYFPGADVALAALYLWLVWAEARQAAAQMGSLVKQTVIAVVWQLPGLLMGFSLLTGLDGLTEFAYYFVFMLELWQTPVLPWLSLLPPWTISGWPVYYILIFVLVVVLICIYLLPVVIRGGRIQEKAGQEY